MRKLTARQREVLEFIRRHTDETGYPPTRADIARELGFRSANAAEEHLKALVRKGAISVMPGTSRGIKIRDAGFPDRAGIPIVGHVAAGNPMLTEEHIDDHCEVPPTLFNPPADYFLRVRGDSMMNCGILDGDLLAVHRTPTADNGNIVVARVDDEVTVKRFTMDGNRHLVTLVPENPDYSPIKVDLRFQEFVIEGLGVGVIRR